MAVEIKIPGVGESVQEAILAQWYKADGETVKREDPLFVIETDKVTLEVVAEADGVLKILVREGETVAIGTVVGTILTGGEAAAETPAPPKEAAPEAIKDRPDRRAEAAPPGKKLPEKAAPVKAPGEKTEKPPREAETPREAPQAAPEAGGDEADLSPSVRRLAALHRIDPGRIKGSGPGGRITKGDVLLYLEARAAAPDKAPSAPAAPAGASPAVERKPMSPIRKRIAARLLEAKQNTAMLTTFNDIDMSRTMEIRSRYKDEFKKKHDVALGFMSFFIQASVRALMEFPQINAFIDGDDIVFHHYYHIGIAVGSPRGLVVPVIRDADRMGFADIERAIIDYVAKIQENRLELSDLEGATFTITNGGVFGSLLSTPILNPPQSGILGMHRIEKRPVVIDNEIVIRPMMYVALSYDHRIVDGREAVTFLKRIKEMVENPERMLMEV
ncbi:2-oxoglutarate dehydrogenase complex dihydrolipoyllysine-residue succinyltransferase [Desulfococcus sp.]|uniref:2-oxoglutarate dehydrogenase complex dihydrolipoyllysine-residue succinyltransferase n=1 Tax=Desulfococcus sp. TaxID=2025834 RepID=UPI00359457DE